MPLVSVVTPTQSHNADHLEAVWASLADQDLPAGWSLEWLVQGDGVDPVLRDRLPDDDRIRYDALGVQIGSPATRNHALAGARGGIGRCTWVMSDCSTWTKDDVLPRGRGTCAASSASAARPSTPSATL